MREIRSLLLRGRGKSKAQPAPTTSMARSDKRSAANHGPPLKGLLSSNANPHFTLDFGA